MVFGPFLPSLHAALKQKSFLNKINGVLYCNIDSIDGFNRKSCIRISNIDTLLPFVCLHFCQHPQILRNFRKCFQKCLLRLHNLTFFHSQSLSLLSKRVKYGTCFKVQPYFLGLLLNNRYKATKQKIMNIENNFPKIEIINVHSQKVKITNCTRVSF